jgi:hypothetical protein
MPERGRYVAMTSGYDRTFSPAMARPMIIRWISLVPSKILKLVELRPCHRQRSPLRGLEPASPSSAEFPGPFRLLS